MNKSKIIEGLYSDRSFKKICQNIAPPNLSEDLFHEIILVFLEMDESKVIKASEQGYLRFMFVRIATNLFKSTTSPFYKKYCQLKNFQEITSNCNNQVSVDTKDECFETNFDILINKIELDISNLGEYERELFKLYVKFQSYRKVSEEVGIKYESVRHAIIQAIEKLKNDNEQFYNDVNNDSLNWSCFVRDSDNTMPKHIEDIPD